jgi:hypothetical protein
LLNPDLISPEFFLTYDKMEIFMYTYDKMYKFIQIILIKNRVPTAPRTTDIAAISHAENNNNVSKPAADANNVPMKKTSVDNKDTISVTSTKTLGGDNAILKVSI